MRGERVFLADEISCGPTEVLCGANGAAIAEGGIVYKAGETETMGKRGTEQTVVC